jgi:predicted DCC family thiol-disulfide oxidoreductase YuxK
MRHLILFDDRCPFCHRWVHRIIRHDPDRLYAFAPLKSDVATHFSPPQVDSLILIENYETSPTLSIEGTATARIARHLPGSWGFLGRFVLIFPNRLLNALYRLIARNRHTLSQSSEIPPIPPEWKDRFLA